MCNRWVQDRSHSCKGIIHDNNIAGELNYRIVEIVYTYILLPRSGGGETGWDEESLFLSSFTITVTEELIPK